MASSTPQANNSTDPRELALIEAIQRKRRQLDEEIETFKALKEQEFRAFEARLRKAPGEIDVGKVEASLKAIRARIKVGKTGKEKKGHERDREREFEGVFTPRCLPLLGGKDGQEEREKSLIGRPFRGRAGFEGMHFSKEGGRGLMDEEEKALRRKEEERVKLERGVRDGEEESRDEAERISAAFTRLQQQRVEARNEIANARRGAQSLLSSSAEYRRSGMASPPPRPARPLSSSVPPEHALDERRLSSRSDASIDGLRSSLRNSREPRSPKRVQFSIDDTVVSPSTSPVANRADASVYRNPTNPTKGAKGFERFEVLRGQREGKTSSNGTEGNDGGSLPSNATLNTPNKADSRLGSYLQSLGSRPGTTLPSSTGAEEAFDILDNDEDVFEFDEDIRARGPNASRDNNEEGLIDDDEGEPVKGDGPSLIGSSPHAGSLPIEIKWGASMRRSFRDD